MRRRALLASLGSLTTGCLATPPSSPSNRQSSTPKSSPSAEYHITDLSVTTSTDRPSVKYVIKTMAFYSADAVEGEREDSEEEIVVKDISEIENPAVREAIETALREDEWRSNSLPDGLVELVKQVDFFTGVSKGETYTHIGLEFYRLHPDRPPAIEFNASVTDEWVSSDSPGAVELSLINTAGETQEVFSGTVPPFGMVFAVGNGDRFLLWRSYTEEGCVFFTEDGYGSCDIGIITSLKPGEEIAREYKILPSTTEQHPKYTVAPGPGNYRITDTIGYSVGDGAPRSTLSFDVAFTLE